MQNYAVFVSKSTVLTCWCAEFFRKVFTFVVEVSEEGTALCLDVARKGGVETGPGICIGNNRLGEESIKAIDTVRLASRNRIHIWIELKQDFVIFDESNFTIFYILCG